MFAKAFGPYFSGTIARTAYGFPLVCNWYDNANRKAFEGSYGVVERFILSLPANSLFIDIGSNQGGTCILAAQVLRHGGGRVMAYEPNPRAFEMLRRNLEINACQNVLTYCQGVGQEHQKLKLNISDSENSGSAHIAKQGIDVIVGPISLRDIQDHVNDSPIFVKIDTEGYEMEALKGISDLLSANLVRQVVIEIDDFNLRRFGSSAGMIYRYMEQFGFMPLQGLSSGHYDEVFHRSDRADHPVS
jgi:FkbM family methyltransferase